MLGDDANLVFIYPKGIYENGKSAEDAMVEFCLAG
jgi:hypothetical protein